MKSKKRVVWFAGLLVAVVAAVLMVAPIASAHFPLISVSLDCNGLVSYNVHAGVAGSSADSTNVQVYDDAALTHSVGSGVFNAANDWRFSGSYTVSTLVTSVTLWPRAVWASGAPPSTGDPATATRPTNCKLPSSTVTDIHNAAHATVTSVPVGSVVHDRATVSGTGVTPTGNVTFDWFANGTCTGDSVVTSAGISLVGGSVDATTFAQTVSAVGAYGFRAHYQGDNNYSPSDGACEPLTVADATVRTDIHNASHAVVTTVASGTVVHDKVFVTKFAGHPGLGAAPDRQRHVPSLHDDRLHRRHGRPDRRPRSRRHGRDERLHDDERHVVQGGLRRRRELPGTLRCV